METAHRRNNSLVVGLVLAALAWPADRARAEGEAFFAVEHARQTIYHSPQTPGFTSWVGAWTMPDGSLMICFTQATGAGRRASAGTQGRAAPTDVASRRPPRL